MHANDHYRAGDLVLSLSVRDGLVAYGTWSTTAHGSHDVAIGQWPQRAVKDSLSDARKEIHALLGFLRRKAPAFLLTGRGEYRARSGSPATAVSAPSRTPLRTRPAALIAPGIYGRGLALRLSDSTCQTR